MTYDDELIARCDNLLGIGILDKQSATELIGDFIIAYGRSFEESGFSLSRSPAAPDARTIGAIRSWLCRHRDQMAHELAMAQASSPRVSSSSKVHASVTIDMSVLFAIEDDLREDERIDPATRGELISLLREMVGAAQRSDAVTVSERLRKYLEIGANAATVIMWLGPLLMQLGAMLPK